MTSSDIPRPSHYAGNHPGGYVHPQQPVPPRKRTGRTVAIVLGVIAVIIALCGVGAVVVIGGGATAVKHQAVVHAADVKITGCSPTVIDTMNITYTIVNSGSTPGHYLPRFEIRTDDDVVVGNATDFPPAVQPGQTYKGKAIGILNVDNTSGAYSCILTGA